MIVEASGLGSGVGRTGLKEVQGWADTCQCCFISRGLQPAGQGSRDYGNRGDGASVRVSIIYLGWRKSVINDSCGCVVGEQAIVMSGRT